MKESWLGILERFDDGTRKTKRENMERDLLTCKSIFFAGYAILDL